MNASQVYKKSVYDCTRIISRYLLYGDDVPIRERLIAIIDLDVFNMKTVCKLANVNYSTYRNAKPLNFSIMSDELVNRLLNTIYMIAKHYPN